MRSFVAVTLVAAIGCGCAKVALAQAAPVDTVVINSRLNIELPKSAIPWRIFGKARYSVSPATVAHTPHDKAVACDTTGDATVSVSNLFSTKRVLVKCRPVKTFGMFNEVRVDIAKGPFPMPAIANIGWDGVPVKELAGTAEVEDTTVIKLENNVIHPRTIGRTRIDMDFAGLHDSFGVEVYEQVTSGPVTLTGGEMKSWRLPRGRYEINLTPVEGAKVQPLRLSMYKANCAPGRGGPQHIHCVTYEEGALIVRNTRDPGPRTSQTGNVWIIRQGW
jgi:hypothetical protein